MIDLYTTKVSRVFDILAVQSRLVSGVVATKITNTMNSIGVLNILYSSATLFHDFFNNTYEK